MTRRAGLAFAAVGSVLAFAGGAGSQTVDSPSHYLVVAALAPNFAAQPEIVDATGAIERKVGTATHAQSWQAGWSPDRSQIAWIDDAGVHVERADGSDARLVVPRGAAPCRDLCVAMSFAWSPDGARLLVGGAGTNTRRLVVADLSSSAVRSLVRPRAYVEYRVVGWSVRGIAYLRYAGNPGTASCCRSELYVARADGRKPRRLFAAAEPIHDTPYARWSPDGRSIAFVTEARDPHDPRVAVVDVATRVVRRLRAVRQVMTVEPAWSPDSARVAFARGGSVAVVSRRGRGVRVLKVRGDMVAWSPSGELAIVCGQRAVCISAHGTAPPALRFRLPAGQAILSIDPA